MTARNDFSHAIITAVSDEAAGTARHPIIESLTRPYPVSLPMVLLVSLVPLYLFIPDLTPVRTRHLPELALDRVIPLQPIWSLIYGALYVFLIMLPVFVVHQPDQIRRTVYAYLSIWITAYVFFFVYPTVAPRPEDVMGEGFAAWGLRSLYSSDPPYNCFPSLHVAHSFVSAFAVSRVHRGMGIVAILSAALVGLSTLFTKQHYVADVIAGVLLALAAYFVFLRKAEEPPELDRHVAPALTLVTALIAGAGVAVFWILYRFDVTV